VNRVALILAGILVVQAVFSYFRTILFVKVTEKSLADHRQDTFNHLIRLPVSFFDKRRVGELNSRISGALLLASGELDSGELFSFVLYSGFIGAIIGGMASVFTRIQRFLGATEDLFEIFDEDAEDLTESL
jgi:ABC-type bacteriocin/lantibiotic exporter with double-glycine peptidase domain